MPREIEKKRFGIYSNQDNSPVVQSLRTGVLALGQQPLVRNANSFDPLDVEKFDVVLLEAGYGQAHHIPSSHKDNSPVLLVSDGYFGEGYYQLSLGYLNNPFSGIFDSKRADTVGVSTLQSSSKTTAPVSATKSSKKSLESSSDPAKIRKILVIGQKTKQLSHGLSSSGISPWLSQEIASIKLTYPEAQVFYQDLGSDLSVEGWDEIVENLTVDFTEVDLLITYSSKIGFKSILKNIPTISDSSSFYSGYTINSSNPSTESIEEFINRLAYSQFTLEEIAAGWPIEKVLLEGSK